MLLTTSPARMINNALSRIFIFSIVLLIAISSHVAGQTGVKIYGEILDSVTGAPVVGASVEVVEIGRYSNTDNRGKFLIDNLPVGIYSIQAKRLGYSDSGLRVVSVEVYGNDHLVLNLSPIAVKVSDQQVESNQSAKMMIRRSGNRAVYTLGPNKVRSLEEIAEQIPELEISSSGSEKYIRIRGADLDGTAVMLDGHLINSTLSGRADISSIPFSSISEIEIVTGGDYSTSGLAGAVNFITKESQSQRSIAAGVERGSYGFENYSLDLNGISFGDFRIYVDGESGYESGKFSFIDPRDSVQTRINNFNKNRKLFGKIKWADSNNVFKLNLRYFKRDAGVPGAVFQITPEANTQNSEFQVYTLYSRGFSTNTILDVSAGQTGRTIDYESPRTPTNFIPYNTRFKELTRDLAMNIQHHTIIDINFFARVLYESLDGKDLHRPESSLGFHSRLLNSLGLGTTYQLPDISSIIKFSTFTFGVRKDGGHGGDFWAPSSTVRLNFDLPATPGLDFSYSASRRLPDMIDAYWKEDAFATPNPDLLPEKARGFEIGLDFSFGQPMNFEFRGVRFERSYNDLIIWRKWAGNKFKPVNLSKAEIAGWEFSVDMIPFDGPISLFWRGSFIEPLNKEDEPTHHDKYLTYRPVGTQNAGLSIEFASLSFDITGRHLGERYITEENTKYLPGVDLVNLEVRYKFEIKSVTVNPYFAILNAGDIQYEVLERQPEKPREYKIKLEISI